MIKSPNEDRLDFILKEINRLYSESYYKGVLANEPAFEFLGYCNGGFLKGNDMEQGDNFKTVDGELLRQFNAALDRIEETEKAVTEAKKLSPERLRELADEADLELETEALTEWCEDVLIPAMEKVGANSFGLSINNGKVSISMGGVK